MAKKKTSKATVTSPLTGDTILADNVFGKTIEAVQTKMQRKGMLVGHNPVITVLPVPSFIVRVMLQNEGLPLSCIYQVVGPQASYKSTLAIEILRWHRLCGGMGLLCEAETKPTPELRNSVLNWDTKAVHVEDCATFEDWQRKSTWMTKELQKRCEAANGPGRVVPWCNIVDSLTGKASEHTLKNINKEGHANLHFPVEARQMADFMRAHPQNLLGWPFTFVGVNHLKVQRNADGSVDHAIPGGWALKFQCAFIIEMERLGSIKEFSDYRAANIRMTTLKNSYGPDNVRINVRFKTWYQEDAPGINRLHSRFEWWEASILFIAVGQGLSEAKRKVIVPKMQEVCDIHEKAGGSRGKLYWSKRLEVPSSDAMSAHDLGMLLETRPDVLADLYRVCGVQRRPFFKPGIDFIKQLEGHKHYADQADAADDQHRRMQELQESCPVSLERTYPPEPMVDQLDDVDTGDLLDG